MTAPHETQIALPGAEARTRGSVSRAAWAVDTAGLGRRFGPTWAVRDVDLRVGWGERVALLGANGAGKTTLLKLLATSLRPTAGRACSAGRDALGEGDEVRRRVGLAGHQTYLYADLTVEENLVFYARLHGVPAPREAVAALLRDSALWPRRGARVRTLSRGLQQRAAVARALVHDPPLLLLDEADTGLDAAGLRWLASVVAGGRRTVVLTTHAPERARAWCDRTVTLEAGRLISPPTCRSPQDAPADGGLEAEPSDGSFPIREQTDCDTKPPRALLQCWLLLQKDALLEWRTWETLAPTGLFGLLSVLMFAFALDPQGEGAAVAPGAMWVGFLFAGVLALGRSLGLERERETLEGLLLAPIDRGALLLAKTAGGALVMLAAEAVLLPVGAALFAVPLLRLRLVPVLLLGTLGFAALGTLLGAMAGNARSRDALLPLLLFPLAVPVVIGSVRATTAVVEGAPFGPWLGLLAAFDAIVLVLAWWLFGHVVEE